MIQRTETEKIKKDFTVSVEPLIGGKDNELIAIVEYEPGFSQKLIFNPKVGKRIRKAIKGLALQYGDILGFHPCGSPKSHMCEFKIFVSEFSSSLSSSPASSALPLSQ